MKEPGKWTEVRLDHRTALFAVHHDLPNSISTYTVCHGLTGKAVVRGLPRERAIAIANALQEKPELWRFTGEPSEDARAHVKDTLARWK